ncbi:MAG: phage tail sheath subtilisin-like domain-containing protein [Bacteroides sp.]|nr:phage tail sheath subtilisin-like domain-containing protein [Prevotella sp.]MCM1407057.1 phage tail sheath subtilisin-like domain-containing protein [Treponema brennaborense]MCM1470209.1 phage tail sheath subtilisin-like domain-containing protein [Bacteroides sp.]
MAIPFTEIPDALLIPGQYQEIDNSLAGSVSDVKKALIIGTMAASGTAAAGKAVQVRSTDKAKVLFGNGSPAAIMAAEFLSRNTTEELWVLPIAEPSAGTKWTQSFAVIANNAAAGSVSITVNGDSVSAAVKTEATAKEVASAITAAVNGSDNFPVEAEVIEEENSVSVSFSAAVKGESSNAVRVTLASLSSGVTITAGTVIKGTLVPDLAAPLEKLGAVRYHYLASEFSDVQSLKAIAAELKDRYTAIRQIGGRCFIALSGELGDVSTDETMLKAASTVNSPHILLVPRGNAPALPCVWAAAWCAVLSRRLADDPAANTTDLEVEGLEADEFDFNDRDTMLNNGICTYRLDTVGTVLIERAVTSYTENTDGARDTSYLDIQVVETIVSAFRDNFAIRTARDFFVLSEERLCKVLKRGFA